MPRSRRSAAPSGRSAPVRPSAAPSRPTSQPTRTASTAAGPPATTQKAGPPAQAGQSSGLFGNMASTAAGVAVGSSIGHAIGGLFGGSSSAAAETQQPESAVASQSNDAGFQQNSWGARSCEPDAKSFTKCLDENAGNMQICGWYLDQLVGFPALQLKSMWITDPFDETESMSISS
ncbi:hypothetical protein MMC29_007293 [Sticta canariensis]|nr:hypothetical protein [Sticta canariensis]